MSGGMLYALAPRMRRAAIVLLPSGLVIGAGGLIALRLGYISVKGAGELLALAFVLLLSGGVLLSLSWLALYLNKR